MKSIKTLFLTLRHKVTVWKLALLVVGIGLVASSVGMWGWATAADSPASEDRSALVTAAVARFKPATEKALPRLFTGLIKSRQNSDLGFKRTGRLEEIFVDQGDSVASGQPLAQLDTAILQASLKEAQANLSAARALLEELTAGARVQQVAAARARVAESEAQVRLSESQFQRRRQLRQSGAISEQEFDDSRFQLEAAKGRREVASEELKELVAGTRKEKLTAQQAVVQQWESTVKRLEVELEESTLVAPFSGVVSRRFLDQGTVVAPGTNVLSLLDQQSLEIWLGLPAAEASSLQTDALYSFDVAGTEVQAEFKTLLPELDSRTRTVTAVFSLSNSSASPRPHIGALARLKLQRPTEQEGYWIDTTALVRGQRGLWSIYQVASDAGSEETSIGNPVEQIDSDGQSFYQGTIQKLEVELLEIDTDEVLVRGPIVPDSVYVREGVHKFTDGQDIQFRASRSND